MARGVTGREPDALRESVRERYANAALAAEARSACGCKGTCTCGGDCDCDPACCAAAEAGFGAALYPDDEREGLPEAAVAVSLGCGNPAAVAGLREGEVVLDLGSGGGIDVLLSARRVGPSGRAYGVDMTDEMLELARRNAAAAGVDNVEFLQGRIEDVPLPAASVDVIISNCVVNLSPEKPAVLREAYRVLRPGGRLAISDVVAEDHLSPAERRERGSWVGCIAGALSRAEYRRELLAAGFADPEVAFTHEVADGLHGAIVRAVKPRAGTG